MRPFNYSNSDIRRFWEKVSIGSSSDCWNWTAATSEKGYGLFSFNGDEWGAHRFVLTLCTSSKPSHIFACHSCDNTSCCNPWHLFWGTASDNNKDAAVKLRKPFGSDHHWRRRPELLLSIAGDRHYSRFKPEVLARGSRNAAACLTESQVLEIRRLYSCGFKQVQLAKDFGVSQANISGIVMRKTWRHI